tara:strand:+ start:494 stop:1039 length:546 start_codon:yes stop_codon:yes gene_type:complete
MSELRTNRIVPRDGLTSGTGIGGGIIQVKSKTITNTFDNNSETFADITGVTVTITPTRSDSKILVMYNGCGSLQGNNAFGHIRIVRVIGGSTNTTIYVGDQGESSQARTSSSISGTQSYMLNAFSGTFMDAPATTSAVIYKMQAAAGDSGVAMYIGRDHANSNEFSRARTPTSITVMEISG